MSRKTTHTENLVSLTLPHSEKRAAIERYKKAVTDRKQRKSATADHEESPPWKIGMDMSTFEKLLESDRVRIIEQDGDEMIIEIEDDE